MRVQRRLSRRRFLPKTPTAFDRHADQLGAKADRVAFTAQAALDDEAHVELASDLGDALGLAAVSHRRRARDDREPIGTQLPKLRDQLVGERVRQRGRGIVVWHWRDGQHDEPRAAAARDAGALGRGAASQAIVAAVRTVVAASAAADFQDRRARCGQVRQVRSRQVRQVRQVREVRQVRRVRRVR